jgi:parallel beta-helix repeat protein
MTNGASATDGGAIRVDEADLTIIRSAITNSDATGGSTDNGGGIYTIGDSGTPQDLVILDSTVSGNTAEDEGGGIYTSEVDFTLRNSTVSGNRANEGAGIYLESSEDADEISNSTIARNTATGFAGGIQRGPAELRGSIVAGNLAPVGPDLNGPFAFPASFSIIGDTSDATIDNEGGNLLGVDPKLKPLKNNGGPTDTHALKKSPAKNKLPKSETPKSDQRGAKRKGKGDIGAYELVKCEGVIVNRVGTAKKDKLKGTKRKDGILGLGGNDKLQGKKGKDGLCGGRGKDKLKGGPGKDKLDGGPGKDKEVQ